MTNEQLEKYLCLLDEFGWEKADDYKNTLIPSRIYKYFPFDDISDSERNIRSLKALKNEDLWLSSHKKFNDKLEFKAMNIDKIKMSNNGYSEEMIGIVEEFYEKTKATVLVSCFSKRFDNMAMWNFYANENKGYCIEYEIFDKRNFYPVIYDFKKYDGHELLIDMINTYSRIIQLDVKSQFDKEYKELERLQMRMISLLYLNYSTKKSDWKGEEEIRLIFSEEKPINDEGKLKDYFQLRIKPRRIIVGNDCSEINRKFIEKVGRMIGIGCVERFDIENQSIV